MLRYSLVIALETLGQFLILAQGVPIYRSVIQGETFETQAPLGVAVYVILGACLIQAGYWSNFRVGAEISTGRNVLVGHVILALGRLNFIFVSGMFSVVFFLRYEIVNFTLLNIVLLIVSLFSGFCYTLELERLAKKLGA